MGGVDTVGLRTRIGEASVSPVCSQCRAGGVTTDERVYGGRASCMYRARIRIFKAKSRVRSSLV